MVLSRIVRDVGLADIMLKTVIFVMLKPVYSCFWTDIYYVFSGTTCF